jgi:hypothetical protein
VRIDSGLTGVIRSRGVIRPKISIIQLKFLSAFADNQMLSGLVFEPDFPQITNYFIPTVSAIRQFQIVRIEVSEKNAILFEPGYGVSHQPEFVSDVMQPVNAGDQIEHSCMPTG